MTTIQTGLADSIDASENRAKLDAVANFLHTRTDENHAMDASAGHDGPRD